MESFWRNKFYEDPIIAANPDKLPKQERVILFEIPEFLPLLISGRGNEKIHFSNRLKTYSAKKELRIPIALSDNFVEVVSYLMNEKSSEQTRLNRHEKGYLRIKENVLTSLNYILKMYVKNVNKLIIYEKDFMRGLITLLLSVKSAKKSKNSLAEILANTVRLICNNEGTRGYIATYDDCVFFSSAFTFLKRNLNENVRHNMLLGLYHLCKDDSVKIIMMRQKDFLDMMFSCWDEKKSVSIRILKRLLEVKENMMLMVKGNMGVMALVQKDNEIMDLVKMYKEKDDVNQINNGKGWFHKKEIFVSQDFKVRSVLDLDFEEVKGRDMQKKRKKKKKLKKKKKKGKTRRK